MSEKTIKITIETGLTGIKMKDEVKIDGNMSKEEAYQEARELVWNNLSWYWNEEDFEEQPKGDE